jgi:citrate lyase gamma subunit
MVVLLTGCVAWASAIFFGPWALTKYLEGQAGDAVEVSGLRVTPKLAVTASRVQVSNGGAVTASLRGVEVDWRLLTGDEPAVLVSVANGGFAGSTSIEDLQVTVTQAENGEPLKISGTAARAIGPRLVSAADVTFDAHTDYNFQLLSSVTANRG